jgi:hypothetical protein
MENGKWKMENFRKLKSLEKRPAFSFVKLQINYILNV